MRGYQDKIKKEWRTEEGKQMVSVDEECLHYKAVTGLMILHGEKQLCEGSSSLIMGKWHLGGNPNIVKWISGSIVGKPIMLGGRVRE